MILRGCVRNIARKTLKIAAQLFIYLSTYYFLLRFINMLILVSEKMSECMSDWVCGRFILLINKASLESFKRSDKFIYEDDRRTQMSMLYTGIDTCKPDGLLQLSLYYSVASNTFPDFLHFHVCVSDVKLSFSWLLL